MNLQTLQTAAKSKQRANCPMSSSKTKAEPCIEDSCFAFIPSAGKCFYFLAAEFGLDIIKGNNKIDISLQSIHNFQELFREHYNRVFKIAYRMLRSYDRAEDVTQEVFIRVYKNIDLVGSDTPPLAWLYKITTNLCLDELRRRKKVQIEPCADFDVEEIHKKFRGWRQVNPEDVFDEKESMVVIDRILRSLPAHYCQALLMKCVDGLSYKDIAYATDTTIAAIRSKIFRARKQFIKLYAEFTGNAN